MLRVVRTPDGLVVLDERGRQPGRGAYVCPEPECVAIALKKKLLERSLKVELPAEVRARLREIVSLEGTEDVQSVEEVKSDVFGTLGLAHKAGELIIGQDRVIEGLTAGKQFLVLLTNDHSAAVRRAIAAKNPEVRILRDIGRAELGQCLGLRQAQIAALPLRSGFAGKIMGLLPNKPDSSDSVADEAAQTDGEAIPKGGDAVE